MANEQEILINIKTALDGAAIDKFTEELKSMEEFMEETGESADVIAQAMDNLDFDVVNGQLQDAQGQWADYDDVMSDVSQEIERMRDEFLGGQELVDQYGDSFEELGIKVQESDSEMANITERLSGNRELTHELTEETMALAEASSMLGQDMQSTQEVLNQAGKELVTVQTEEGNLVQVRDQLTGKTEDLEKGLTQARGETRQFKEELLSSMFFAMQMEKSFGGLMQESMGAVGVFDVFSQTLKMFFLPIALTVLDWALAFMDFVNSIPSGLQKLIGAVVLAGFVFGKLYGTLSVVALGLEGVYTTILKLGGVTGVYSSIVGFLTGVYSTLAGVVGTVVGLLSLKAILIGALIVGLGLLANWLIEVVTGYDILGSAVDWVTGLISGFIDMIADAIPGVESLDNAIGGLVDTFKGFLGMNGEDGPNMPGGNGSDPMGTGGMSSPFSGSGFRPNASDDGGGRTVKNIRQTNNIKMPKGSDGKDVVGEIKGRMGEDTRWNNPSA